MNKKYKDLYLKHEKEGYEVAEEKSKEMYKKQKEDREKLLNKVARIVITYTIIDEVIKLSKSQRKSLNEQFGNSINNISESQYKNEKIVIDDILKTVTKEKYYKNVYTMNIGMDFNMKRFSNKEMKKIIDSTIDGKVWSDRLWRNKKQLERELKKEINELFQGKTNINDINSVIRDKFNQNAFNTKRLVETEVSRCQNQANEYFAEEHGVERQMFVATLDDRTSEICQENDSKIFDIDDPDKPIPPLHPFCRSVLISIIDDWKPSVRKDNVSKEYIDFMSYEDWKEENNV